MKNLKLYFVKVYFYASGCLIDSSIGYEDLRNAKRFAFKTLKSLPNRCVAVIECHESTRDKEGKPQKFLGKKTIFEIANFDIMSQAKK